MQRKQSLKDAARDLRFLLDAGYNRKPALEFVASNLGLGESDRNFLVRYVFSTEEAKLHKSKRISPKKMKGQDVVVDGYNVLITAETILSGGEVVEGMDGFVRDIRAAFSGYRFTKKSQKAAGRIMQRIAYYKPKSVLFVLDSQMSRSGELARYLRKQLASFSLEGDAVTSHAADHDIKKLNRITLTSDSAIIKKVDRAVDLGVDMLSTVYS